MSRLRSATSTVAWGRNTSWRRMSAAPSVPDAPSPRRSPLRAMSASISVIRAARTLYSTRRGAPSLSEAPMRSRVVATGADQTTGLADRAGETLRYASEIIPGYERPALQSVRRPLSYAIASAATCAPFGAASRSAVIARTVPCPNRSRPRVEAPSATDHRDERRHRIRDRLANGRRGHDRGSSRHRAIDLQEEYWMKLRKLGVLAAAAAMVVSACSNTPGAPGGTSNKGTLTVAIELPQQGSEKAASDPIINGIKLAVKHANNT